MKMLKTPPRSKLNRLMRKNATIRKYTLSGIDDAYGQKSATLEGTYTVKAEIQEITSEDLAYFVPGTVNLGDAWGYFQPNYLVKGKTIMIAAEDEVTWNGKTWRVDTVENNYFGEKLWYCKALLKRKI